MHPEIVKLLDLQTKDSAVRAVDDRLEELAGEEAALDADLAEAQATLESAGRAVQDAARRRDELESKIEMHRQHQERRREKLEYLHSQREIAALMAEIDLARSVLANEESEWVKASDQVQALQARVGELEEELARLGETQQEQRADLAGRRAGLDRERAAAVTERESSAEGINRGLLVQYDRLRSSRNTAVVVALSGAACGACFTAVPLNRRSQIRSGQLVEICESCGVILYAAEEE